MTYPTNRPDRWWLAALIFFLLLAITGCVPEWLGPSYALPWSVPKDRMDRLWAANDSCVGRRLPHPSVRWHVVPGETFDSPHGEASGWWETDNRIYIASADTLRDWVLRHELLHASLGHGGHPPIFQRCNLMP